MRESGSHVWFLRLRLFAAFGAFIAISVLSLLAEFDITSPGFSPWFFVVLSVVPLSHVLSKFVDWIEVRDRSKILLILDCLVLTALLSLSGGPSNPFSLVYLVHVVLAALLLDKRWTWLVASLTSLCFASLFLGSTTTTHHGMHGSNDYALHLYSMFGSYCLVAMTVAYFLGRILDELREKERRVLELVSARERLLSLAALSANAAHELGSPLTSIEVIAHELELGLRQGEDLSSLSLENDVATLKQETQRCKQVLSDLCSRSGTIQGEAPQLIELHQLRALLLSSFATESKKLLIECHGQSFWAPLKGLEIALRALIRNALDASGELPYHVKVSLEAKRGIFIATVEDKGCGASKEDVARFAEPFFTTKAQGMGLGVYLAQLFAEQTSGTLHYRSEEGVGTLAVLSFPLLKAHFSSEAA